MKERALRNVLEIMVPKKIKGTKSRVFIDYILKYGNLD